MDNLIKYVKAIGYEGTDDVYIKQFEDYRIYICFDHFVTIVKTYAKEGVRYFAAPKSVTLVRKVITDVSELVSVLKKIGLLHNENYYTPKREEFCVGFEYEMFQIINPHFLEWSSLDVETGEKWVKTSYPSPIYGYSLETILKDQIRVKYLDEADFLELGWEHMVNFVQDHAKDYWRNIYRNTESNHDIMYDEVDHEVTLLSLEKDGLHKPVITFKINNKSEMKKLLNQLQ